jgi:hypothetical protein
MYLKMAAYSSPAVFLQFAFGFVSPMARADTDLQSSEFHQLAASGSGQAASKVMELAAEQSQKRPV